jgi:predicted CXXCH cytochrome family protein
MVIGILAAAATAQPTSVVNSPHNLSASGPGPVKATMESEVCIFCHAPHNALPIHPLWNRNDPVESYAIYTSRSLEAKPGQPTGNSKMCLSCHDGTIALGSVVSRGTPIQIAGGITTIPAGASNIGTDLRDDHPISFRYDTALVSKNAKLINPGAIGPEFHLDSNSELQCTTCHDAHNDSLGNFLVKRNDTSQLCISCHKIGTTTISGHQQCADCHQPHTAPSGPYLLKRQTITDTCLRCHNGLVAQAVDITTDINKVSPHDTHSPVDPPDPQIKHTTCASCHEPHTMMHGGGSAPTIQASLGSVAGNNSSGSPVSQAQFEYEVCFKCHAEGSPITPTVPRQIAQNNMRLQFNPSAASFHPVETFGRNPQVPSLRAGWTPSSIIYCSSCHASDSSAAFGSSGPNGVHGSNYAPILGARYEVADQTAESSSAYALCYKCHDRVNLLSDASFPFHKEHIVDQRTPCAACHDAHGIPSNQGNLINNSRLINFATNIVLPDPVTHRLEFRSLGMNSGECYLSCHGVAHSPMSYPQPATAPSRKAPPHRQIRR